MQIYDNLFLVAIEFLRMSKKNLTKSASWKIAFTCYMSNSDRDLQYIELREYESAFQFFILHNP